MWACFCLVSFCDVLLLVFVFVFVGVGCCICVSMLGIVCVWRLWCACGHVWCVTALWLVCECVVCLCVWMCRLCLCVVSGLSVMCFVFVIVRVRVWLVSVFFAWLVCSVGDEFDVIGWVGCWWGSLVA